MWATAITERSMGVRWQLKCGYKMPNLTMSQILNKFCLRYHNQHITNLNSLQKILTWGPLKFFSKAFSYISLKINSIAEKKRQQCYRKSIFLRLPGNRTGAHVNIFSFHVTYRAKNHLDGRGVKVLLVSVKPTDSFHSVHWFNQHFIKQFYCVLSWERLR